MTSTNSISTTDAVKVKKPYFVRLDDCTLAVSISNGTPDTTVGKNENVEGRIHPCFSTVLSLKGLVRIPGNLRFTVTIEHRKDVD